jgi:hypothetical protein
MSEAHLDRYVNEFSFRQNTKDDSDESTSPDLADWEIKFHGGNSLLTLYIAVPSPGKVEKSSPDLTAGEFNRSE